MAIEIYIKQVLYKINMKQNQVLFNTRTIGLFLINETLWYQCPAFLKLNIWTLDYVTYFVDSTQKSYCVGFAQNPTL